jgi:hypothetical protein
VSLILQSWCQIQRTTSSLRNVDSGPGHIQCIYSSTYSGVNIQLNVDVLLLEISRQCNARYTAIFVPNTAHNLQFTLCGLWSRPHAMKCEFRIFRLQYSTKRSSAAIGDISTIQCVLSCKVCAKCRAHPAGYAM